MATTQANSVLRHLRPLLAGGAVPDQQLLEQFLTGRDEAAFAALVRRHGPLVYGACRRVLGSGPDAEDAFQAAFLVLARKAGSLRRQESLAGWLYQVSVRVALRARGQAATRRRHEGQAPGRHAPDPLAEVTGRELLAVFDEELQRLPERLRTPLVLCYLEGQTRDEAAGQLGCSTKTLKRRLDQAKDRLGQQLARRGVVLPAALLTAGLARPAATAAVPALLGRATVQAVRRMAAGEPAAGIASARALALVQGALGALPSGKLRAVGALLLAVSLLGTGLLARVPPARTPEPAGAAAAANEPPPAPAKADADKGMTITGRVLDDAGKPLAGADVAVLAEPKTPYRGGELSAGEAQVLGLAKADADGRFRLRVARTSSLHFRSVLAVARRPGHGLGWLDLNPDAARPEAEVRLPPEQIIQGRFVDLQGNPAAGVTVRLKAVGKLAPGEFKGPRFSGPARDLPPWPEPATTDAQGRFVVHGAGRGLTVFLGVGDDRFATQDFAVATDAGGPVKELSSSLEPAHFIEGLVRHADTGAPVPNARLTVYASKDERASWTGLEGRADARGRFRINPLPGQHFSVTAYAPDGEPYLALRTEFRWPRAALKHQLDLELPRGVLVRGKITEGGSGAAVAGATVQFVPRTANNPHLRPDVPTGWEASVVSAADGTFAICVLPGPGHLVVHGPTPDYVLAAMGYRKLVDDLPGGRRQYAHAFVPLDLQPGAAPHEAAVTLRRGATVRGRVVGPDGKPVAEGLMVSRLHIDPLAGYWRGRPEAVRDGRFELHGLDPDGTYPVYFLDARNKLGATVELSGKQAGQEVSVRLAPCGSAATRLVDAGGKPLAGRQVALEIVVTPGPHYIDRKSYLAGELSADADVVANVDRLNHWNVPRTDADGRVTFPALIPGATYRIIDYSNQENPLKQEFRVEAGESRKLPDVVRKAAPQ
jgi:RNA polymerase sigma factor (sigma-70 family)